MKSASELILRHNRKCNKFVKMISIYVAVLLSCVVIALHFGQFSELHFEMPEP